MWSETVGLRTRPVWDQKIGLGLAGLVLFYKPRSCHARRRSDLEGHRNFSSTFIVSLFCAWNITTVEINSGDVAFTYLKFKSAKCLCLLPVVLVLSFWSWSCKQRSLSWSWSYYFGLGLKNLVLFTPLPQSCWLVYLFRPQCCAAWSWCNSSNGRSAVELQSNVSRMTVA